MLIDHTAINDREKTAWYLVKNQQPLASLLADWRKTIYFTNKIYRAIIFQNDATHQRAKQLSAKRPMGINRTFCRHRPGDVLHYSSFSLGKERALAESSISGDGTSTWSKVNHWQAPCWKVHGINSHVGWSDQARTPGNQTVPLRKFWDCHWWSNRSCHSRGNY